DATIVIVENCTAELSRRKNLRLAEKRAVIVQSITAVAQPLLFSLLIILASFAPVFFLEQREARLFDPLAFTKTFAMGFSTLLTLFLLPIVIFWIFGNETDKDQARAYARIRHSLHNQVSRHSYVFTAAAALILVATIFAVRRFAADFSEKVEQLGLVLIAATIVWLFQRRRSRAESFHEGRAIGLYRSAL